MDTTADEPHAFQLRRSPSSGSTPLPSARSTKRKLSIAAFGSSPSLGSHPLPSPISAEHTSDDIERGLHHASSSRNTLDSSDHPTTSTADNNEQTALINSERRCHRAMADYDFGTASEDRRDPRSSATCLVVNVTSPSQNVTLGQAPTPLTETSHVHSTTTVDESDHVRTRDFSSNASDNSIHQGNPLQSSLSQQTFSGQESPERRGSSSSGFGCFYFQAAPPHTTQTQAASELIHLKPLATASTSTEESLQRPHTTSSPIKSSADHQQKVWLRSTSSQSENDKDRLHHTSEGDLIWTSKDASFTSVSFQLNPVPPFKRRKVHDFARLQGSLAAAPGVEESKEQRRSSLVSHQSLEAPTPGQLRPIALSQQSAVEHRLSTVSGHASGRVVSNKNNYAPALPSLGPDASGVSFASSQASSASHPVIHRKRTSRSRRSQSVPNMRVKATLDVGAVSQHQMLLPPNWSNAYAKASRVTSSSTSRNTTHRSSKRAHPSLGQYVNGRNNSRLRSAFTPAPHPPITRHTLRELDLFEILKNPQLRHDVVFDPNVQFRPNFDGERGRRKREAGERYWTAIVREIELGCTCTAFDHGKLLPCTCGPKSKPSFSSAQHAYTVVGDGKSNDRHVGSAFPSRIPLLVQELRSICLSILPSNFPAGSTSGQCHQNEEEGAESKAVTSQLSTRAANENLLPIESDSTSSHHHLIATTLDPNVIAKELQRGVLDVSALITFMGSILKLHCAPMRDEAIEKMVKIVCVDHDIGKGLRLCFEILELMKLDIANHQLRSTRPYLVETAVDFEVRWFKEQIEQGKMSLAKTTAWLQQSLSAVDRSEGSSHLDVVTQAFNDGMLRLVFDIPGSVQLLPSSSTPLTSPSSSSLNNTFASYYPETFQFDAYRMMTFHNDVADLTIVYMLVLLFRQLCCSPLDDGATVPASASSIAQNQLKAVKGEIWCLLNDANLCLSGSAANAASASPGKHGGSFEDRLFFGTSGGFTKLEHPRWRKAMQNVLLQVAARASAVQMAARQGLTDPSLLKPAAPSAKTQSLLNAWMQSNLCAGSGLHKLCQKRLREVVISMLGDKLRASSAVYGSDSKLEQGIAGQSPGAPTTLQRVKSCNGSTTPTQNGGTPVLDLAASEMVSSTSWEANLSRAGLDPFAGEIKLLSDRISKVAIFHVRVFRKLYEKMDRERQHASTDAI